MGDLRWLRRYCCPDSGVPAWEHPYRFGESVVVTDARCLLAVRGDLSDARPPSEMVTATARSYAPLVSRLLPEQSPDSAMLTDLPDLWLWLDYLERVRCPQCDGYSAVPDDGALGICMTCDGAGWVLPGRESSDDVVTVCGHALDRNRLAWWLCGELAGGGPVCVWPTTTAAVGCVVFATDAWRLAVAALDPTVHAGRRYRGYAPGAGLWWHHRADPMAATVAADWFQDHGYPADTLFPEAV